MGLVAETIEKITMTIDTHIIPMKDTERHQKRLWFSEEHRLQNVSDSLQSSLLILQSMRSPFIPTEKKLSDGKKKTPLGDHV